LKPKQSPRGKQGIRAPSTIDNSRKTCIKENMQRTVARLDFFWKQ
jgi:hypothetical protein